MSFVIHISHRRTDQDELHCHTIHGPNVHISRTETTDHQLADHRSRHTHSHSSHTSSSPLLLAELGVDVLRGCFVFLLSPCCFLPLFLSCLHVTFSHSWCCYFLTSANKCIDLGHTRWCISMFWYSLSIDRINATDSETLNCVALYCITVSVMDLRACSLCGNYIATAWLGHMINQIFEHF